MVRSVDELPLPVDSLFGHFFDYLSEAVVMTGPADQILRVNRSFTEMFGYTPSEVSGSNIDVVLTSEGPLRDEARQFSAANASGKSILADTRRRKKDGTLFPVSVLSIPVVFGNGRKVNFMIFRDRPEGGSQSLGRDEQISAALLEHSPNPILVINPDTSIRYVNRSFEKLTGYALQEIAGARIPYPWWTEDRREINRSGLLDSFENGADKIEYLFRSRSGDLFWIEATGIPVRRKGVLQYYLSNWVDITERKKAQEKLAKSEESLRLIYESSRDGFWDWDVETGAAFFWPQWARMLGYEPCEIDQDVSSWEKLIHQDDREKVMAALKDHLEGSTESYESTFRMRARDGSWKWILARGKVVSRLADGRPKRMVGTQTDISGQKALEEKLVYMASHDQLTGLYNRHYFNEYIEKELRRSDRYGHPVAFLMADIDGFKSINDTFGHHVGDVVLRDVARLLAGSVRDIDTVVRYGGDEFLIVLVETDGEKDFVRERILAEVERRKIGQDILGFPVTISIGGSYLNPGEGSRLEEVLAEADRQMYQEKTLKKEREIAKGDLSG
jgi:diguanylate cyclase (GGDEF)-like protein/PAS domain S-box-containing protein